MTRKLASSIVAMLTLVSLLAMPSVAQDTTKLEEELPGVQAGYMRMYMADPEATPVADLADGTVTHTVMFMAYRFDAPDSAASAMDIYTRGEGMGQFFEGDTDVEEIADLGDRAVQVSGTTQVGDTDDPTVAVLVQEGTDLYIILAMGGDSALADKVIETATVMIAEDVPDNEVVLRIDGTSTGRVFEVFAAAEESALVSGLMPMMDMDLMLEEAPATPAA